MDKLMPPIIAGTLPAFYNNTLTVPFQMNRAVSYSEVASFDIKIKTVQNSRLIAVTPESHNIIKDFNNNTIIFIFPNTQFRVGQHYKIQIAYVDHQGTTGFYSSVGIAKYTTKPIVEIMELEENENNLHKYTYTGRYSQELISGDGFGDTSEKLYSYKFNLYDYNRNLIATSGEKIHNSTNDIFPYESLMSFTFSKDLEKDKKYYLILETKTINNLIVSSPEYIIVQKTSINPTFMFDIEANASDEENGVIKVYLKGEIDAETLLEKNVTGSFKLLRSDNSTNYTEWNEILDFNLYNQAPTRELFVDYTIEHGVYYKYAIVQYSKSELWSEKKESNIISCNFEHAYLYDGKRQLKIKYNPKVSSFKNTILESKVDTIGSKYPFIFRNGNVGYKEFPISGLISLQIDEDNLFYDKKFKDFKERPVTDIYIAIDVVNKDFYNYDEIWQDLYIIRKNKFISLKKYCKDNKISYREAYSENEQYYFYDNRFNNPYQRVNKTIYPTRHYLYSRDFKQFYIYRNGEYISLLDYYGSESNAKYQYDATETYFLRSVKQIKGTVEKSFDTYSLENIQLEREFKLEVLDWLNNGQPKLFRSPVEGNYIVRLMNISLTPVDGLGRLLHTFNATAYEIADIKFETLKSFDMLNAKDPSVDTLSWETVNIHDAIYNPDSDRKDNLLKYKAVSLKLEGMLPGDRVYINDGVQRIVGKDQDDNFIYQQGYEIVIGATGSYNIDLSANVEITQVSVNVLENSIIQHQGSLTYAYYRSAFNLFDTIKTIKIIDTPIRQIKGKCKNSDQFLNYFNDLKHSLQKIYFIRARYLDPREENGKHIYPIIPSFEEIDPEGFINIDGEPIYLKEIGEIFIDNPEHFNFSFGEHVIIEICYQSSEINYDFEDNVNYKDVYDAKKQFKDADNLLFDYIYGEDKKTLNEINVQRLVVQQRYEEFLKALDDELKLREGDEGNVV